MNLQMQLRRGVIALFIVLALGGLALGRARLEDSAAVHGVGSVIRAVEQRGDCASLLRIGAGDGLRLDVPCDRSCAPLRSVLRSLHVAATGQTRCVFVRTA